jgi:hypothetical protein
MSSRLPMPRRRRPQDGAQFASVTRCRMVAAEVATAHLPVKRVPKQNRPRNPNRTSRHRRPRTTEAAGRLA